MSRSADGETALVVRTAGLTAVVGAFVMVSWAVFTITGLMGLHNVLVGAITVFVAVVQAYRTDEQGSFSIAIPVVLAVLGIWIAIAPILLFDVERELVLGINGVSGALIVILSLAGAYGTVQTSNSTATSA